MFFQKRNCNFLSICSLLLALLMTVLTLTACDVMTGTQSSTPSNNTPPAQTNGTQSTTVPTQTTAATTVATTTAGNLKTKAVVRYIDRTEELTKGESYSDMPNPEMDVAALKAAGYTQIKVTIRFEAKRNVLIGYNYASMEVSTYAARKQLIDETYFPTSWEVYTMTWTVPIESANPNGGVTIRWWAESGIGSKGDGWKLGETEVEFEAQR